MFLAARGFRANEDAVSVAGNVIAFAALALNQITGSSIPQGVAAVLIALVLIRISLRLIQRSHDFLVGAWTGGAGGSRGYGVARFTQPIRPAEEERVRAILLGAPGVTAVRELLFTFLGPGRVWIVARVDLDDGMRGAQVKATVPGLELDLKRESEPRLPGRRRAHWRSTCRAHFRRRVVTDVGSLAGGSLADA